MKRSEALKEFRALDLAGLDAAITERKKEMMELRFKAAVGQLENPARISGLRREVARLGTIATEKRAKESTAPKAGK
jgi:large subunit ribosomal protein L29